MARLADDYKNFRVLSYTIEPEFSDKERGIIGKYIEIERIAKPEPQMLIYRIIDAFYVLIGRYDAVYYHECINIDKYRHFAKDGEIIHHSYSDALHIVDGGGYSHSERKSKSDIKLESKLKSQWVK